MNYSLGRSVSPAERSHLAGCKKCRKTLARLEGKVLAEGLEMKGQASVLSGGGPLAGQSEPVPDASARYGW